MRSLEGVLQAMTGGFWIGVIAAGKSVDRSVSVFRPGMETQVGLGEQGNSGHPLGFEFVSDEPQQGRASSFSSLGKSFFNEVFII